VIQRHPMITLTVLAGGVAALWAWSSWQRHKEDPSAAEWRRYIHGLRDRARGDGSEDQP
jgi:hypothetical protein